MIDEPPALPPDPSPAQQVASAESPLPTERRADGSLVIDLKPLAPTPQECLREEPDPFNPEIVVCRKTQPSPRIGPQYGPPAEELIAGSAIPRARLKLSEDAEIEANVTSNGVGGWNANGGEVRVKIDF